MENVKRTTLIAAAALLLAIAPISAQAVQEKSDSSLQFSAGFYHANGADSGILNLDFSYGYFLTTHWEVGIMQTLAYDFIDDAEDWWVATTVPFINYNFMGLGKNDNFQPFIGAFIGASYNDDDATGTLGPQVGFKAFVTEKTFVNVKYRYEWFFDELTLDDIEDTRSDGNHVVTVGLGFVF